MYRWENNTKMDFSESECEGKNWIQLVPNAVQWDASVDRVTPSESKHK
jgi:hypothetical protein